MADIEWKCPRCQAPPNACGKAVQHLHGGRCDDPKHCSGFICECDPRDIPGCEAEEHGTTLTNRCENANCYHCGWGGTFPKLPGKMPAWAKKALEAGWTPPTGWQP